MMQVIESRNEPVLVAPELLDGSLLCRTFAAKGQGAPNCPNEFMRALPCRTIVNCRTGNGREVYIVVPLALLVLSKPFVFLIS